jgi:FkbM family methyltransferase
MKTFSSVTEIKNLDRYEFEQTCIDKTDHLYIGDHTVLCKVLARYKMYIDSTDMGIAPHLIMDGYWESWITKLMAQIIKPGYTCLDIGANFGYFSILMSELSSPSGKTFSFEPNPHIVSLLKATSFVNGGKFEVIEAAVSEKQGEAVLTVNDRELGGGTIKPNELIPGRSQVNVQVISVDDFVQEKQLHRVDLIKIDVEGIEPLVFKGMQKTMAANPDIHIIVEYSPSLYPDAAAFTQYLFAEFTVFQVKDFVELTELSEKDISALLAVKDHRDLYLRSKKHL